MNEPDLENEVFDPAVDRFLRVVVTLVLIGGGSYAALEFTHWLLHGGFRPFIVGVAFVSVFFFLLILWAKILSRGMRYLQTRPSVFLLSGLATAAGILAHHFLFA